MASIFEAKEVYKHFGGIKAVDGFSMEVGEKQITGLIGPNGAGKTTFFNVAAGFIARIGVRFRSRGTVSVACDPIRFAKKGSPGPSRSPGDWGR